MNQIFVEKCNAPWQSMKGSGRQGDPILVERAADVDSIFRIGRSRCNGLATQFIFGAGIFPFSGAWAHPETGYCQLKHGDQLIGAGKHSTIFKLENQINITGSNIRPDIQLFNAGCPQGFGPTADGVVIRDLTIDGDFRNLRDDLMPQSGIRVYGHDAVIKNVRVMGLRGSEKPVVNSTGAIPYEAFGISFGFGSGHVVRDCEVCACAPGSYLSAFSSCEAGVKMNLFDHCMAEGGENNHAAFTVYSRTALRCCSAIGFRNGIYNDTDLIEDVWVRDCLMLVDRVGCSLVSLNGEKKMRIQIHDSQFLFTSRATEPIGMELYDRSSTPVVGTFGAIRVEGCAFRIEGGPARKFFLVTANGQLGPVRLLNVDCPAETVSNVWGNQIEQSGIRAGGMLRPSGILGAIV
jgi:hypothetical protein